MVHYTTFTNLRVTGDFDADNAFNASTLPVTATGRAFPSTLADRFSNILNMQDDFGCLGDGIADDTAKFQAAAAVSVATGQRILVPAGTYQVVSVHVHAHWILDAGVTLSGNGRLRWLRRGSWTDAVGGANLHKLRDKVLVASACDYDGGQSNLVGTSWLGSPSSANYFWLERSGSFMSCASDGGVGVIGASRVSDKTSGNTTIGVAAYALNDVVAGGTDVWGAYIEAASRAGVTGVSYGLELDVKNNTGLSVDSNPYARWTASATIGAWICAGGDPTLNAPNAPSSAAVLIGRNSEQWLKGIVFDKDGLVGADGTTGTGTAIEMAKGHEIHWSHASGQLSAKVGSEVTAAASGSHVVFTNTGLEFRNSSTNAVFGMLRQGGANYWNIDGSATANSVKLGAAGTDTNVGTIFGTKGTFSHEFRTNGAATGVTQLEVYHTASANRYVRVSGSNGGNPKIGASAGALDVVSIPLLPSYTVATLPTASTYQRGLIYVSDGTSNKRLAVSDGTNWRWPDGVIVS